MRDSDRGCDRDLKHKWRPGLLVMADGRFCQFGFWYPSCGYPLFAWVWCPDGGFNLVHCELLETPDVLTEMAHVADNPFVWWRKWPRRLWQMVNSLR